MLRKLLNNAKALILADQAIVSGSALLTQFIIAGSLGIAAYGRFSAIVLVQLFILSVQQAGITGMYQVIYPGIEADKRRAYFSGVWNIEVKLLLSIIIIGIASRFVSQFGFSTGEFIVIMVNIILFLLQDFFRRIFLTNNHIAKALVIDALNNGLQIIGLAALSLGHIASFLNMLWFCAISFVPAIIIAIYWLKPSWKKGDMKTALHHHNKESIWMVAAALLQWFAGNFYVIAAGWWLGAAALGILRLGQYIFGLINVLLQAIENYLLPKSGALYADPHSTIKYLRAAQKKMFVSLGAALVLAAVSAKPVLQWLHYDNQNEILTVIYGMSCVYILVVFGYPVRIALRALKLNSAFFLGYLLNAIFGFCTAYFFIHQWNLTGVLAGLLLSQMILLVYWLTVLQQKYSILWK